MKKVICDICKKEAGETAKKTWATLKFLPIQPGGPALEKDLCELCALTLVGVMGKWTGERRMLIDRGGKKNNGE